MKTNKDSGTADGIRIFCCVGNYDRRVAVSLARIGRLKEGGNCPEAFCLVSIGRLRRV